MPYYLVQTSITTEAWAAVIKNPQNRREAIRAVVERLGGKLHFYFMSFGDYDTTLLVEMPDNVAVTAMVAAAMAGGANKAGKTTPLLTLEDAVEAFKKAGESGYRPPAS
jgi:uncharacterized protein with GYD domain